MKKNAAVVALLLASSVCEALGPAPGYQIRITRAGIDPLINGIADLSEAYAKKIPVPDTQAVVSSVSVTLKDRRISTLDRPTFVYTLQGPNKLLAKVQLPKFVINGLFQTRQTLPNLSTETDQGTITTSIINSALTLSVTLGTFEDGTLRVDQRDCTANLGPSNLVVANNQTGASVEPVKLVAQADQQKYAAHVCNVVTQLLTQNVNRALAQVPSVVSFSNGVSLKGQRTLALTQDFVSVSFSDESITGFVSPWAPVTCATSATASPQARLALSDGMFNKLLYLDYKNGLVNFTLSPSSPPALYSKISLGCDASAVCLGTVDKTLIERFGKDALVELQMEASVAPTLEFKDASSAVTAGWRATVSITKNQAGAPRTLVASGTVSVSGLLRTRVQGPTVYGSVSLEDTQLKFTQPEVQSWDLAAKTLFRDIVQTYVNDSFLKPGLPLPSGLSVEDASVTFMNHCVQASASVNYAGVLSSEE